jgi:hypothetical protein
MELSWTPQDLPVLPITRDAWADDREANRLAAQDEQAARFAEYFPTIAY